MITFYENEDIAGGFDVNRSADVVLGVAAMGAPPVDVAMTGSMAAMEQVHFRPGEAWSPRTELGDCREPQGRKNEPALIPGWR